jgi:hypothetical protein
MSVRRETQPPFGSRGVFDRSTNPRALHIHPVLIPGVESRSLHCRRGIPCTRSSLLRTRPHGLSSPNTSAHSSNPNALVTRALSSRNLSIGLYFSPYGSLSRSIFRVVLLSVALVLEVDTVTSNNVTRSIPLSLFQSSSGFCLPLLSLGQSADFHSRSKV